MCVGGACMSVWKTVSSTRKLSASVLSAHTPSEARKTIPGDFLSSPRRGRHKQTNLHESEKVFSSVLKLKVCHPLSSWWLSSVLMSASGKSSCWGKRGRCSEGFGPQFRILFHRVRVHGRMFLLGLFRLYFERNEIFSQTLSPDTLCILCFHIPLFVFVSVCVCCPTSLKCTLSVTHMVKLYVRYPMFSYKYFIFSLGCNISICIPTAFCFYTCLLWFL